MFYAFQRSSSLLQQFHSSLNLEMLNEVVQLSSTAQTTELRFFYYLWTDLTQRNYYGKVVSRDIKQKILFLITFREILITNGRNRFRFIYEDYYYFLLFFFFWKKITLSNNFKNLYKLSVRRIIEIFLEFKNLQSIFATETSISVKILQ